MTQQSTKRQRSKLRTILNQRKRILAPVALVRKDSLGGMRKGNGERDTHVIRENF